MLVHLLQQALAQYFVLAVGVRNEELEYMRAFIYLLKLPRIYYTHIYYLSLIDVYIVLCTGTYWALNSAAAAGASNGYANCVNCPANTFSTQSGSVSPLQCTPMTAGYNVASGDGDAATTGGGGANGGITFCGASSTGQ